MKLPQSYHLHSTRAGLMKCYHECRSVLGHWEFWLGLTLGFPFEHLLWEKIWPFKLLTHWLGL